jgi:lipopolysaccharide export system permease protein
MNILERYIGRSVSGGVLSVIAVLMVLYAALGFVDEFDQIGQHKYTIWHALGYSLLRLPERLYQFFPLATLLGTMIGLGMLSRNGELVVIRSSGVRLSRLILAIMKTALILIVAVVIIGEVIAPPVQQYANLKRVKALSKEISLNTEYGLWAREDKTFIHVRRVTDEGQLQGVVLYQFDNLQNLESVIRAATADHVDSQWLLKDVIQTTIEKNRITESQHKEMTWASLLDPELVNVVSVTPEMLPVWKLDSYIAYLEENGLDASQYKLAFWSKLIMPFTILAMVLIAIPFVFVSQRQTPIGKQILIGFLLGISFFILSQLAGQVGVVYQLHPLLVVSFPTMLVAGLALMMLRRIR